MRILILGGYGVFGGRLAVLLKDLPNVEIYICGRNLVRATNFCNDYEGPAKAIPLCVNRNDLSDTLLKVKPDVLVDASGPFQLYGNDDKNDDPYTVIKSCIKAGINYMDLADGADFVFGVANFNIEAKTSDIFILSGVSSFPVLTSAVLNEFNKQMQVHSIVGGIAPSPHTHYGLNVVRAAISYAGGPVKIQRDGKQKITHGLTESIRFKISPPGIVPLKDTYFSLIDVPDLQILPDQNKSIKNIWLGVGPTPEFLHRSLIVMAKIRKSLKLKPFTKLSPLFQQVLNFIKIGEHRGGMFIEATGIKNGRQVKRSWHMIAEGDDGPYIPSMAAEGIIRKMLAGKYPVTGARVATKELKLKDYKMLFDGKPIYYGFREELNSSAPLYMHLLDSAFEELPQAIKRLHGSNKKRVWSGNAGVVRGKNLFAKIIAALFEFPKAAKSIPVSVTFTPQVDGSEKWERDFNGTKFSSVQRAGIGKNDHLLLEKFGPAEFAMTLILKDGILFIEPKSWTLLGIPMPKFLLPNGTAFEADENGYFVFNVEIMAPIIGLIVAYKGLLKED